MTAEHPMVRLTGVAKRFTKGKETISIFDHLDLAIPRGDFIAVILAALTLCLTAALYPAWRASRLDPVDAIRRQA